MIKCLHLSARGTACQLPHNHSGQRWHLDEHGFRWPDSPETSGLDFWWLSFADGRRPSGQQFLGVAIVRAEHFADAIVAAHSLKCNPGGSVKGYALMSGIEIADEWLAPRLLDRAACTELDQLIASQVMNRRNA